MNFMKINDLDGQEIEITDLAMALLQADDYRHYQLSDPAAAKLNARQQAYWEDFYQKLVLLDAAIKH
jgi:hypothetical protein